MTIPALIQRNSGTPVADAATSTSLARDYKPVRPGRESTENRAPPTKHERGVLDTAHVGASTAHHGVRRRLLIVALLAAAAGAGVAGWWFTQRNSAPVDLVLHGNVDLRQVDAGLQRQRAHRRGAGAGRRPRHKGDSAGPARYQPPGAAGRPGRGAGRGAARTSSTGCATAAGRRRSRRPRPMWSRAKADAVNARRQYERLHEARCSTRAVASQQDLDDAKAALAVAEAKLDGQPEGARSGGRRPARRKTSPRPRRSCAATRRSSRSCASSSRMPSSRRRSTRVVRSRLMEPGEMASPQRPVFSLAITDPKWVRAYVSETEPRHGRAPA